jgi:SAM-dependent methyltransferase
MSLNYDFVADLAGHFTHRDARVLDYGSGDGRIVAILRSQNYEAFGCDRYGIPRGWFQGPTLCERFIRTTDNSGHIPFDDGFFDAVTANMVFEHIDDFGPVLREIHRVLMPGDCYQRSFRH